MSCLRPGPLTSNGYLNFLRDYRKKCCGLTAQQTVVQGAKAWNKLSNCDKNKYRKKACGRKMKPTKRGCKGRRRRKKKCRKRRRSCPRPKGKCTKTGPVTNNAYLNFLRAFRRCNCNLTNSQIIRYGARKWCSLPDCTKEKFRRQACKVAKSCRQKQTRVCKQVACAKKKRRKKC